MTTDPHWQRDVYTEAVWASDLPKGPRIVALCYAFHADDLSSWCVTTDRLAAFTGMPRIAVDRALRHLGEAQWITYGDHGRQDGLTIWTGPRKVWAKRGQR